MRHHLDINEAYSILGLKPGASPALVKQAYRQLVKRWHPDGFPHTHQKQQAEEKIKQINEAYNLLKFYQPNSVNQPYQNKQTKIYTNYSNAEKFYNSGVENAELGRYSEAITDFTQAIRFNPYYVEAYKYRGFICSVLGYEYRATSDLNKAAQIEGKLRHRQSPSTSPYSTPRNSSRWGESKLKFLIKRLFWWIKRLLRLNRKFR
jgi:curved DNA-binding protein CbpA